MEIDEILSSFDGGGQRNFVSFETFVLNLLKHHIQNQGKSFMLTEEDERRLGDAYVENGFDNFKGTTLIEIKYSIERFPSSYLENYIHRLISYNKIQKIENILIINQKNISQRYAERLVDIFKQYNDKIKVTIWGADDISKLINKHRKQAEIIAKNLFSLRLEKAVGKDGGDWKKERDERIESLTEAYERGQFSLFLGAGVSSSAGMPDWNTLLNSLFVSYLTKELNQNTNVSDKDIKQIVLRLSQIDEPSALMAARYLRKGLSKETSEVKEFTKTITHNLYNLRDTTKNLSSELIISIANLCMPRRTGARVKSLLTYNFDDLIEKQLETKSIRHHSIYTDNEAYDPDDLPIYHVHGFLPENADKYQDLDKSTLVFSEEGYHLIYSEAYHWSNLVQLMNLRENNCLMIGLSMTDPNLRRLLDISARNIDRQRHYAFMRRMTIEAFAYEKPVKKGKKKQLINNVKGAQDFLHSHHKLNEEIMKELGVSIIWFEEFEEIPQILKMLNEQ